MIGILKKRNFQLVTRLYYMIQGIKILNRSNELAENGEGMFGYKLPIDGNDIMEYKGIGPGPDIKKYQEYLLKMAFNNVKALDREACFKYIKNIDANRI